MKTSTKEATFKMAVGLAIMLISIAVIMLSNRDKGDYNHCVEWDNWIHRENLLANCYDFINQNPMCTWTINEPTQTLDIININGSYAETFHCSKLLKSVEIERADD
jgi:hypothetical protein|tara:strand:- start:12185 stop:12502 length:318 start_codon:yes stop_codon:yes gene_type:complete